MTLGELIVRGALQGGGAFFSAGVRTNLIGELEEAANGRAVEHRLHSHEGAAVNAAHGFARTAGAPGVAFIAGGGDAIAAFPAIRDAYLCYVPMLVVSVGHGDRDSVDLESVSGGFRHFYGRITRADEAPAVVRDALQTSQRRRGPSLIELAERLLAQPVDKDEEVARGDDVEVAAAPDPERLSEAAFLLELAARPAILAGAGAVSSGAGLELQQIAERLAAPVVTTWRGKGAIPESHPLAAGAIFGEPESRLVLRDADLLLAVGTSFDVGGRADRAVDLPPQIIQVDVDASQIGRRHGVRVAVVGDAKHALTGILRSLSTGGIGMVGGRDVGSQVDDSRGGASLVRQVRQRAWERARAEGAGHLDMLQAIREALPPNAATIHEYDASAGWFAPFFEVAQDQDFLYPAGQRRGFAVPAAMGAAAAGDRPVVGFCDQHSFVYRCSELPFSSPNARPFTLVVSERPSSDGVPGKVSVPPSPRSSSVAEIARSFGLGSAVASTPEELGAALRSALDEATPQLIHLLHDWSTPRP